MSEINCCSKQSKGNVLQYMLTFKSISLLTIALLFSLPLWPQQSLRLFETTNQLTGYEAEGFHQPAEATRRVRISSVVYELSQANVGMQLEIELFDSQTLLATIDRVNQNINGTKTLRARLKDDPAGYLLLSVTGDDVLGTISAPGSKERFVISSENQSGTIFLHKLDRRKLTSMEGSEPMSAADDYMLNSVISESIIGSQKSGNEITSIDVMVVYTPAAAQWANQNEGNILNTIAQAIELGQLALENSETMMTVNLVHSPQLEYIETGNAITDLQNLTYINGVIDEVHTWRDQYGADLVCLFSLEHSTGGVGWLLQNKNGNSDFGYSLTRVQQASWTYTAVHEMAHNMGCHHHKQQNVQPGPTYWQNWPENIWSAGWRWTGNDNGRYASVMTYESGQYFPDGINHTRVPYFSNPSVSYQGVATGHATEGDNARTLREVRYAIAAYRTADPVTNYSISTSSNPTAGGTTSGGGTYASGSTGTVTASANNGYAFSNWTEGTTVVSNNANYTFTVSGDRTLVANFTPIPVNYTITTISNPTAGGTTSGGGSYANGSTRTVTANANDGYTFSNWTEGTTVVSINANYTFMVSENRTLTANFKSNCEPGWSPIPNLQYNMQLVAKILIDGQVSLNPNDVLGAFVGDECRGIGSPSAEFNGLVFLTVSSDVASGEQVELKIWNSSDCSECNAIPGFAFVNQAEIGTSLEPYQVRCGAIQNLSFGQGYTWFSLNVNPGSMSPNNLFTALIPCYDDRVIGQTSFSVYTGTNWLGSLTNLGLDEMYRMKLCSAQNLSLMGDAAPLNSINLAAGYTWLGYSPKECLPINEALANMSPVPSYDDRLIGQNSFALYTGTQWIGTLSSLCPDEGYVIRLANASNLKWPGDENGFEFNCGSSTISDIDGNDYKTIVIGNQCWMKENLKTTKNPSGATILRHCYNEDEEKCNQYGGLYDWLTAINGEEGSNSNPSGVQGICPDGWHLPSDEEWGQMVDYMISQGFPNDPFSASGISNALRSCRQVGSTHSDSCNTTEHPRWDSGSRIGFDQYGFSAFPGGFRWPQGWYVFGHYGAYWWSSSKASETDVWYRSLYNYYSDIYRYSTGMDISMSVRCLKDVVSAVSFPTVSTQSVDEITSASASCGGIVTDDGGDEILVRGVVWNSSPNPSIMQNCGISSDGTGVGTFSSLLTELEENTIYFVRAYATNSRGTSYGEEISFSTLLDNLTGQPCVGVPTITDFDGNVYNTVYINNRCWLKENLKTTHYKNGNPINYPGTNTLEWMQNSTGAYAWYDNDISWKDSYGALYNWYAIENTDGICPEGWHVPGDYDLYQLTTYGGGDYTNVGGKYKSTRTAPASHPRWESPNTGATDYYNFSAIPGGYRDNNAYFSEIGYKGYLWTSSTADWEPSKAFFYRFQFNEIDMGRQVLLKTFGLSLRCVKD